MGFEAAIVHQRRNFVLTWHGYTVPVLWLEDQPQLDENDICVFPEVMLDFIRQTQGFRGQRVVIALSWAPAYNRLRPGERWQDYGITQVMTKSPVIKRYLEWSMDINVALIHEYVDPERYQYRPGQKQPTIAYLTRKDASGEWLHGVLARKGAPFTDFTWLPLRGLSEDEYAYQLRQAALYLPTTLQEGMHVSVIEAMACGCLVVGYAGVGGKDYMIGEGERQNSILVENGNLPALGETVEAVLIKWSADPSSYEHVIANAVATAHPYQDAHAEARSLQRFFANQIASYR